MAKKSVVIMPKTERILEAMGEQIKLARLRRDLSVKLISERSGVSRATIWQVEKGSAHVAIGIYASVLHAISGMDVYLLKIASDDKLGKTLQDLKLKIRKRASKNEWEKN